MFAISTALYTAALFIPPLCYYKYSHLPNKLIAAVKNEDEEKVRSLLGRGVMINLPFGGPQALYEACAKKNLEIVEALVFNGARVDLDAFDHALGNLQEVPKFIVDCGPDKYVNGQGNETYLHRACLKKSASSVRYLLGKGAKVNARDEKGRTPLHYACSVQENRQVFGAFKDNPDLDVNARDEEGNTPLHYSYSVDALTTSYLIKTLKADVNARNRRGETPLHIACSLGETNRINELLETNGIEVNLKDREGNTPLHILCQEGFEVDRLIQKEGDVRAKNNKGYTPFHCACEKGQKDLAGRFLTNENINEPTFDGYTPLDLTYFSGNEELVQSLKGQGAIHGPWGTIPKIYHFCKKLF